MLKRAADEPRLELTLAHHEASGTTYVYGTFAVPENRETGEGRQIKLRLLVLPARGIDRQPDPIFILHGGPGAAATTLAQKNLNSWMRKRRDIVLIDQRGTGRSNPLHIRGLGSDDNIQSYFDSMFKPEVYLAQLPRLQKVADLTQYTTPNAVDDFNDVREGLGYQQINIRGGSYGTRSGLVFMRRHTKVIRTATLQAVQPMSYRNPLPHASGAQKVLQQLFDEVESNPRYKKAFPDLRSRFHETLQQLEQQPAMVVISHPTTREDVTITLSRNAFAECVRVLMYRTSTNRRLPALLMAAHGGDFRRIAEAGLTNNRGIRRIIAMGTLMSVTSSADISRIDEAEIEEACRGTFLQDVRVREQMSVAQIWPHHPLPEQYGDPVTAVIPTLLLSGSHDPTTSSDWADEAARHLPNSLHVVVPGAHGVDGQAVDALEGQFLESGTVEGLDTSAVAAMKMPPLVIE